jgi:hypothetical protein
MFRGLKQKKIYYMNEKTYLSKFFMTERLECILITSMFIKMPVTALALANSKNSDSKTNLPLFLFAGFLWKLLPKGLEI